MLLELGSCRCIPGGHCLVVCHLLTLLGQVCDLRVEWHLDVCLWLRSVGRVNDDDVDLFKVLQQSMQVGQVEPTTCVVPALLIVQGSMCYLMATRPRRDSPVHLLDQRH